jgi:hypothetical protein
MLRSREPEHRAVTETRLLVEQLLEARSLVAYLLEQHARLLAIAMRSDDDRTRAEAAALAGYESHPIWRVPVATLIRAGPPPQARLPSHLDPE